MNSYNFALVLIILAILAFLLFAAVQGSLIAATILGIILAIVLICIGVVITLAVLKTANDRNQQSFIDNAKENLAIMGGMQRVQNQQNKTIMDQLKGAAQLSLPEPSEQVDILEYDDIVFEELDE